MLLPNIKTLSLIRKLSNGLKLELFFGALIVSFDRRIISLDLPVLRSWAQMTAESERKGRVLPVVDSLIAATARAYNLTIITRNTANFDATDVEILNIRE